MRYRKLGETPLYVSEVSFGTIPILKGNTPVLPDYYNLENEEAIDVMKYAYSLGCNFFDTAIVPEYGDAEIKVGLFAKEVGRENIIISDKSRFFNGSEMYQAVLESINNLQCKPDIYFVHQVDESNVDLTFGKYGALDALVELKKEGLIGYTGIASHYYNILERGAFDSRVDVLQGSGNILERGMLDRIESEPAFLKKGVIINKIYAAGILPKFFKEDYLISGVLTYPISTALIGLGKRSEVDIAMKTQFDIGVRPSFEDVLNQLQKDFIPIPCLRCQRCVCDFQTEIHTLFRQYNYYFLGKEYWALRKLDMGIDESVKNCQNCLNMSCMKDCPNSNNIPERISQIGEWVRIFVRNGWIS